MNARDARLLAAAYLAGKARDALRTHVGASLFRYHVHRSLGVHPEDADLERLRVAVRELGNELARRGNIALPFPDVPDEPVTHPDAAPTPSPQPEAPHALPTRRPHARRRVRG